MIISTKKILGLYNNKIPRKLKTLLEKVNITEKEYKYLESLKFPLKKKPTIMTYIRLLKIYRDINMNNKTRLV